MNKIDKEFKRIRSIYSFWGRSGLYNTGAFLTFLGRERTIRRQCVRQLHLCKGDRVIDIACGTGRNHPYLIKAVGEEGSIIGLDFTPEMLERARDQAEARGWKNVTLIQGDAAEIDVLQVGEPVDDIVAEAAHVEGEVEAAKMGLIGPKLAVSRGSHPTPLPGSRSGRRCRCRCRGAAAVACLPGFLRRTGYALGASSSEASAVGSASSASLASGADSSSATWSSSA